GENAGDQQDQAAEEDRADDLVELERIHPLAPLDSCSFEWARTVTADTPPVQSSAPSPGRREVTGERTGAHGEDDDVGVRCALCGESLGMSGLGCEHMGSSTLRVCHP